MMMTSTVSEAESLAGDTRTRTHARTDTHTHTYTHIHGLGSTLKYALQTKTLPLQTYLKLEAVLIAYTMIEIDSFVEMTPINDSDT